MSVHLHVTLDSKVRLFGGGDLAYPQIAYETWGSLESARDNAILLLGGLSTGAHAASHAPEDSVGWWESMIGPEKPIDTDRWYVICVNFLGSCKGSTGPGSHDPNTGTSYGAQFPEIAIEDIADTAVAAIRQLGVYQLNAVIGTSMGAMVALSMLARHPGIAYRHINISGAAHSLPHAIALRSLQRELVQSDPAWRDGSYSDSDYPYRGMKAARKVALMFYRSAAEWERRFGRRQVNDTASTVPYFEIERYLDYHAEKFAKSFDANSFLRLSNALSAFDLSEGTATHALTGTGLEDALVVGTMSDNLFPVQQQHDILVRLLSGGVPTQYKELVSDLGHDAFLVEHSRLGPILADYLGSSGAVRTRPATGDETELRSA